MTLHPDVLRDLLPVYLAGEASPATRALIEEHLARDPELASLVREAAAENLSGLADLPVTPTGEPTFEKAALDETRRALRLRSLLLGLAIAATLLPFSCVVDEDGLRFVLLSTAPEAVSLLLSAALCLWIGFWCVSRRLRVTGL
jgi:anti-sigma factor RsiW